MKLVCMAQMYNENTYVGPDGKTNLRRFMDSISKYCDALVMFDDGSTDSSPLLVNCYRDKLEIEMITRPENSFTSELAHKAESLEVCKDLGADWILWLDCDEVVEAEGERGGVRAICESCVGDSINLPQVNLWRSDSYFRKDGLWGLGLFRRLWKNSFGLHFDVLDGLHNKLYPSNLIRPIDINLKVLHYGFADTDSILRKYRVYKKHGQSGEALERLLDEAGIEYGEAQPHWFSDNNWPHVAPPATFSMREHV